MPLLRDSLAPLALPTRTVSCGPTQSVEDEESALSGPKRPRVASYFPAPVRYTFRNFKIQTGGQHSRLLFILQLPFPCRPHRRSPLPHKRTPRRSNQLMTHRPHRYLFTFRPHVSVSHHPRPQVNIAETEGAGTAGPAGQLIPTLPAAGYASLAPTFKTKRPLTSAACLHGFAPLTNEAVKAQIKRPLGLSSRPHGPAAAASSRAANKSGRGGRAGWSPHLGGVFTNAGPCTLDRSIDRPPHRSPPQPIGSRERFA